MTLNYYGQWGLNYPGDEEETRICQRCENSRDFSMQGMMNAVNKILANKVTGLDGHYNLNICPDCMVEISICMSGNLPRAFEYIATLSATIGMKPDKILLMADNKNSFCKELIGGLK